GARRAAARRRGVAPRRIAPRCAPCRAPLRAATAPCRRTVRGRDQRHAGADEARARRGRRRAARRRAPAAACGAVVGARAAAAHRPAPVTLATRSMIPLATLDVDPSLSLYDIVGRYWPQVLRPPQWETSPPDPRGDLVGVYIDGNFSGGQDALRGIRASAV